MDLYDEIAKVAYEIFEREGCLHGRHFDHWCEAEVIITTRYNDVDKKHQNKAETPKPKKKAAVKSAVKKSKTEPKTAEKTASKSKAKKTS